MDDNEIIDLYWARSETAITETSNKYSRYCYHISNNILHNNEDAEECVNDTYLRAWNSIPPKRPERLSTFLGKITRNLSLNKFKQSTAKKRGGTQTEIALHELEECVPTKISSVQETIEDAILVETINKFLAKLPRQKRIIFVRRYWYLSSISDITKQYGMSESKVKSMLFRLRNKLKSHLEKEGITI